jgi:hypothetical protein
MSGPSMTRLNEAAVASLGVIRDLPMTDDERLLCTSRITDCVSKCSAAFAGETDSTKKVALEDEGVRQIRASLVASANTSARSVRLRVDKLEKGSRGDAGLKFLRLRLDAMDTSIPAANISVENGTRKLGDVFGELALECSGVESIVAGIEKTRADKKSWGNWRHHLVGLALGALCGVGILVWERTHPEPQQPPAIEQPANATTPDVVPNEERGLQPPGHTTSGDEAT